MTRLCPRHEWFCRRLARRECRNWWSQPQAAHAAFLLLLQYSLENSVKLLQAFQGQHGRAFLFNNIVNVKLGTSEDRLLMTGLHTVRVRPSAEKLSGPFSASWVPSLVTHTSALRRTSCATAGKCLAGVTCAHSAAYSSNPPNRKIFASVTSPSLNGLLSRNLFAAGASIRGKPEVQGGQIHRGEGAAIQGELTGRCVLPANPVIFTALATSLTSRCVYRRRGSGETGR